MSLYIYCPTSELADFATPTPPPQICSDDGGATIIVDTIEYTRIDSIEQMYYCFTNGLSGNVFKKQLRDCIKYRADALTWVALTHAEQRICAILNIGTGAQIIEAISAYSDRLVNSFEYVKIMRGEANSEAKYKAFMISAIFFAATKHIEFGGVPMPQLVLTFLNEEAANRGVSIKGTNYLRKYIDDQLQGVIKDDGMTGLYDFFYETIGSEYENAGLETLFADDVMNPLRVTAAQWVLGGFTDIAEFNTYCKRFLNLGIL